MRCEDDVDEINGGDDDIDEFFHGKDTIELNIKRNVSCKMSSQFLDNVYIGRRESDKEVVRESI